MPTSERLQKVLARAGVASRRHGEDLMRAGRVRVNGHVVSELGTRVDPRRDKVEVDGRRVLAEPLVYYIFHKPRGTVSTLVDPEGRATIADYLKDLPSRVYSVGRLDFHTSGAMLLTNDGDLAQALLHPRRSVPKTYVAKVRGVPTDLQIDPWRAGMDLPALSEDEPAVKTRPVDVEVLRHAPSGLGAKGESGTTWMQITLREGRNRQIHRMAETVGLFVMRLARIAFAGITTEGLRPGELRPLTDKEVTFLRATFLRPTEEAAVAAAKGERQGARSAEPQDPPRKPMGGTRTRVEHGPVRERMPRTESVRASAPAGRSSRTYEPQTKGVAGPRGRASPATSRGGASADPRAPRAGAAVRPGRPGDERARAGAAVRPGRPGDERARAGAAVRPGDEHAPRGRRGRGGVALPSTSSDGRSETRAPRGAPPTKRVGGKR